jgi:hypothetical protein
MLSPENYFAQWLEDIDTDQPVSELIEASWLEEEITFTLDELTYLEAQGREYAQELREQGMIAETLPPLNMPEQLLEKTRDNNPDFGR